MIPASALAPTSVLVPAVTVRSMREDGGLGSIVILSVCFLAGILLIHHGFRTYQTSRLIRDTPRSTVQSMAVGRTELEGVARPADEIIDRPFTSDECLYARYEIEEYREDTDGTREWTTIDRGTFVTPFYLEDETGRVLVDADYETSFELSDANETVIEVSRGDDEPPEVAAFLTEHASVNGRIDDVGNSIFDGRRRYIQRVLPIGSSAYVFGGARVRDGVDGTNQDRLVIDTDDSTDRFIVSDRDADSLAGALGRRAPLTIAVGLVVSALCLYMLLAVLVG